MTTTRPQSAQSFDEVLAQQQRRRDIARAGALAQHAKHDPRETTRGAFAARMRRYEEEVDPTGDLKRRDPQALAKRVESALQRDMAKVRLARSKRADEKRSALTKLRATPSNQFRRLDDAATAVAVSVVEVAMLGEELTTLEDLTERHQRQHGDRQNEAAPAETEAAPSPQFSAKHPKIVSSDGGALSVAPTRRRRQTSTPSGSSTATPQKKATKDHGTSKRQPRRS